MAISLLKLLTCAKLITQLVLCYYTNGKCMWYTHEVYNSKLKPLKPMERTKEMWKRRSKKNHSNIPFFIAGVLWPAVDLAVHGLDGALLGSTASFNHRQESIFWPLSLIDCFGLGVHLWKWNNTSLLLDFYI